MALPRELKASWFPAVPGRSKEGALPSAMAAPQGRGLPKAKAIPHQKTVASRMGTGALQGNATRQAGPDQGHCHQAAPSKTSDSAGSPWAPQRPQAPCRQHDVPASPCPRGTAPLPFRQQHTAMLAAPSRDRDPMPLPWQQVPGPRNKKKLERCGFPVTMAGGFHLFPFRTQQLSLPAPMVLPGFPVGESVVAGNPQRSRYTPATCCRECSTSTPVK